MQAPATRRALGQLTVASQEKHTLPACSEPEKHRLTAASGQMPRNNRKQTFFPSPFTPRTMTEDRSNRARPTFALSSPLPPSPPLSLPPSSVRPPLRSSLLPALTLPLSLPPSPRLGMPVPYWHSSDTGSLDMEARLTRAARGDTSRPS